MALEGGLQELKLSVLANVERLEALLKSLPILEQWPRIPDGKPSEKPTGPLECAHTQSQGSTAPPMTGAVGLPSPDRMDKAMSFQEGLGSLPFEGLDSKRRVLNTSLSREDLKARKNAEERAIEEAMRKSAMDQQVIEIRKGHCWTRLVDSAPFEWLFIFAVLTSCLLVGVEVQYSATHVGEPLPLIFFHLRDFYALLFLLELICRIIASGPYNFYCGRRQRGWAFLDTLIVVTCMVDFSFDMMYETHSGTKSGFDLRQLRLMRMLRITRLLRTFRMQRLAGFLVPLRTLVCSIVATVRSLAWALMLLMMLIYVVGILLCQGATDTLAQKDLHEEIAAELRDYWLPLDRAMFTLFQSISDGLPWREAMHSLEELPTWLACIYPIFISFVNFAVLNVVTGVFCGNAIETAQRNPEVIATAVVKNRQAYQDNVRSLFLLMDEDASGLVTLAEFEKLISDEALHARFCALGIDTQDAWTLFKLIDTDKTGSIDMEEFIKGCEQLNGHAKSVNMVNMWEELRTLSKMLADFMRFTEECLMTSSGSQSGLVRNLGQREGVEDKLTSRTP